MYVGVVAGLALALWVFTGSLLYPPNKYPGPRSVKECPFYQQALAANSSFANGTAAEILAKYDDGFVRSLYKPHTR